MKRKSNLIYRWVYAIISFAVLIWLAISTFNFISKELEIDENEEYLSTQLSGLLSSRGTVHFGSIETFLKSRNHRDRLQELIRDYQNTMLAKTIFSNRAGNTINRTAETISGYDVLFQGLREQKERLNREHEAFTSIQRDIENLFNSLSSRVSVNSGLPVIEAALEEIDVLESKVQNLISEINHRESSGLQPQQLQVLVQNFYSSYRDILTGNIRSVTSLKEKFLLLSQNQQEQHQMVANFSNQFHQSTGSVQLLYEHLYPLTRNLGEWAGPVQSSIQTLERNIMPGVTGLSLLRQIDPVSYQAVVLVGEIADQVISLDSEIEDLVANIISLRERGTRFLNTNSRESAVQFVEQASSTASYLESKRTVFDPVYDRLETANNQLNRLDSNINRVRNARARNMLFDLNNRSINMIAQIAQPIEIYRGNVDQSVRDLNNIVESERRYTTQVETIRRAEFDLADLSAGQAVLTASYGFSFDAEWMPFIIIIGIGALNLVVVFILLRNPGAVKNRRKKKVSKAVYNRKNKSIKKTPAPEKPDVKKETETDTKKPDETVKQKPSFNETLLEKYQANAEHSVQAVKKEKSVSPAETPGKKSVSVNREKPSHTDIQRRNNIPDAGKPKVQAEATSGFNQGTGSGSSNKKAASSYFENKSKSVHQSAHKKSNFKAEAPHSFLLSFKILNGARKGQLVNKIPLIQKGPLYVATMGRSREQRSNHISVNDDGGHVSRYHAELALMNNKCYVRNLSQTNPLLLNHFEVPGDGYTPIEENDVLTLGTMQLSAFKL